MKRIFIILATASILLSQGLLIKTAYAVNVTNKACTGAAAASAACKDSQAGGNPLLGPNGVITKFVQIFTMIIGIVAVLVLILAGIRFVTSNGDPSSIATARSTILYAIIGLVVTAVAQAMVSFVLNKVNV